MTLVFNYLKRRRKRLVCLAVISGLILFCIWIGTSDESGEPKLEDPTVITLPLDTNGKFNVGDDIILSAYMNSGSRFTGRLLGFRPDTFYFYEPLYKFSVWDYFAGKDMRCSTVIGPSWKTYRDCLSRFIGKSVCLRDLQDVCRRSTVRFIKLLRLTLGSLQPLLENNEHLKVVHLFRDPRAIIHSRMYTRYYPTNEKEQEAVAKEKGISFRSDRQGNNSIWWRKYMTWDDVASVEAVCGTAMRYLGYTSFDSVTQLRDL
ncbi:hypothetical protein MAR_024324, partial [Mya arenaria]